MSQILTLIVPADWPRDTRACPWQLHAADGRLLAEACSEPGQWPSPGEGDHCRLLLAGRQVAGQAVRLPPPPQGERQAVIAAALEDGLLEPAEHLLFAVDPAPLADGRRYVATINRSRLTALRDRLHELGWPLLSAWPLALALPAGRGLAVGGELTLRRADGFLALPLDATLGAWLDLLTADDAIPVCGFDDDAVAALRQHRPRLQESSRPPLAPPAGPGFLVGDLAPPRRQSDWPRHFRPTLRLAAICGALLIASAGAQWGWLSWQAHQFKAAIARNFREILPQTPQVDPLRQAQRQLAEKSRAAGQLAADDFLALADVLAELPPEQLPLQRLDYSAGRLTVGAARIAPEAFERLVGAARQRGLTISPPSGAPSEFTLTAGDNR